MDLLFHPIADCFPLIEGEEFSEFVADIMANGVREPVVLYEGMILDGRNRYRASQIAGVDCPLQTYSGNDPVGFVVSLNLRRRHLNEGQRAWVAAKLANLSDGQRASQICEGAVTREQAAKLLNVSERSVDNARVVRDRGAPELQDKVARGAVAPSTAADVARLPQEKQRDIVARGEKEILQAAKQIRAEKAVERRTERIERIEEISKGNAPLLTPRRYPIIYADPPWRYENPPIGATSRAIENHYPTMTLEEICALPVADIAAEDALLYLWATAPKLAECFQVVTAWGFQYRTNLVWVKDKIGMGYHARNQHELLLVCRRGEMPPPEAGTQSSSVIFADRTEHSAKPVAFYELIERLYAGIGKIELFSRSPREGWAAWGNQAEAA
jgi:N6-adenosine-specific RNA methylase IME4/ParB-like chromosome segregation protein Spo0J